MAPLWLTCLDTSVRISSAVIRQRSSVAQVPGASTLIGRKAIHQLITAVTTTE